MMSKEVRLALTNVVQTFGKKSALKDISISVKKGEIFGLLGPSGAGKTTTIKLLTGQLKPTSGSVEIFGKPASEMKQEVYRKVGIVTDNSGLYEKMNSYDNLKLFAELLDVKKERIEEILERVGLAKDQKTLAGKLSKGMKQRLILARAMLHQPEILFLDEPTSGLDPVTMQEIHALILELKEKETTIFMSTHNMEEATKLCDHIALLDQGKIMEYGTPMDLRLKYNDAHEFHVILNHNRELKLPYNEESGRQITEWIRTGELLSVHSSEPTLENVFLQVTGGNK
ncbi:ABC-2 type transport system ATP-binding protein [Isobaculum melis]|uniref:ABC-2 type transport system ATP-binding protein n=2 Tax=Isobaculum melis TaxID=142588 RepID=A0A1H9Q084_9LACT|nr:ABC-2 type transport system ATP-binding protein [Isobaculum melis]